MACSILLAVLACAALPGVSDASKKFRGYGFSTIIPSSWKTGKGTNGNGRVYGAASPKTKRNVTVNSTQLGISVIPIRDLERQIGRKMPSSLEEVLGMVLAPPQQAQNASLVVPIRSSTLGGRPAASGVAQYVLGGATVLQSETVAVHRGQVYVVEFDIDQALEFRALPILQRIHRHWRWR